jgi:phosphatidate cytidylyltransferase
MGTGLSPGHWGDLGQRVVTGVILAGVSLAAFWLGGLWLAVYVALIVGIIVWELAGMTGAAWPLALAGLAALACLGLVLLPPGFGLPLVMAPVLLVVSRGGSDRLAVALFTALVILAGYGLIHLHSAAGLIWLVWLVLVVGVTDIFGYFAGRLIGGPKFWPKVSPKKTWSGTVAGWVAAALVGWGFVLWVGAEPRVIGLSIALSMASQMGDIAESALKRRSGVKDSSRLLPGHGGFFDRFDGVLGASVLLLLVERIVDFPPMAV